CAAVPVRAGSSVGLPSVRPGGAHRPEGAALAVAADTRLPPFGADAFCGGDEPFPHRGEVLHLEGEGLVLAGYERIPQLGGDRRSFRGEMRMDGGGEDVV